LTPLPKQRIISPDMPTHDSDRPRPRELNRPASAPPQKLRLGEILVAGGAVTEQQLEHALKEQPLRQLPLGQTLLALGYTTDQIMRQALSSQLGVPYIDLQNVIIDRTLAPLLDREFAREHALFPVARIGRALTVAMDDPTATWVVDALASQTGHEVTVVTSSHDAIHRALARLYDAALPKASGEQAATAPPVVAPAAKPDTPPAAPGPHGYVTLLGLMTYDLPDLLRSIEGGLAARVFDQFVENTGLSPDRAAEFADIGRRALTTRLEEGRFSRDESDRLVRAARIFGGALALFKGDRTTASAWLMSGQPALGGSTPIDLARTDLGAREVERLFAVLADGSKAR
jgi:putative toxin-antitoxin system antitoxin component (TIGR02293 family)